MENSIEFYGMVFLIKITMVMALVNWEIWAWSWANCCCCCSSCAHTLLGDFEELRKILAKNYGVKTLK
jgi:hypothetical protein